MRQKMDVGQGGREGGGRTVYHSQQGTSCVATAVPKMKRFRWRSSNEASVWNFCYSIVSGYRWYL